MRSVQVCRRSAVLISAGLLVLAARPAPAQEFVTPKIDGLALDWCLTFGADCGKPAADAFCRRQGYDRADRFAPLERVGRSKVLATGQVCDGPRCTGFRFIACTGLAPERRASPPVRQPTTREPRTQPAGGRVSTDTRSREAGRSAGGPTDARLRGVPLERWARLSRVLTIPVAGTVRLEVRGKSPTPDTIILPWEGGRLERRFRWSTDVSAARGGLWEITDVPMTTATAAGRPRGYVASGRVKLGSGRERWENFEIDFGTLGPQPPWASQARGGARARRPPSSMLYLRVRPTDERDQPLPVASNVVAVSFGVPPGVIQAVLSANIPRFTVVSYTPLQPYRWDFQCDGVVTRNVPPVYKAGQKIDLCASSDSSWYEDIASGFGSLVDGAIGLAGDLVDFASKVYADLKSKALTTVTGVLASTVGCPDYCQVAVGIGLDAGLAAVGVPPSLPNFDQLVANLKEQGIQAVAQGISEAAASQGIPLPPEAAEVAVEKLVDEASKTASAGSGGSFYRVDPAGLFHPAVVVLEARNPGTAAATVPVNVTLDGSNAATGSSRFFLSAMAVPALAPGRALRVAFEIQPSLDPAGWMAYLPTAQDLVKGPMQFDFEGFEQKRKDAKKQLDQWVSTYAKGTQAFHLRAESKPGAVTDVGTVTCPLQGAACTMLVNSSWPGAKDE